MPISFVAVLVTKKQIERLKTNTRLSTPSTRHRTTALILHITVLRNRIEALIPPTNEAPKRRLLTLVSASLFYRRIVGNHSLSSGTLRLLEFFLPLRRLQTVGASLVELFRGQTEVGCFMNRPCKTHRITAQNSF